MLHLPFRGTLRRSFAALAVVGSLILNFSVAQASEMRAIWVDAWGAGFLTSAEVTTLVSRCTTYHFNAVIVQMRRRGDAFYFPQAPNGDPRTTAISSGFDALADLITKCHAANPPIQVHCWVTTQLVWGDQNNAPSQPGHVYNLHPEYLQKTSGGATFIGEGYFLDPGHPDACQWNYNMALDICSRYNIDGFHWDYIRYPQQDSGYNATAVARYNAEFGLSGTPSPSSSQWSEWRRRQVTDFLRWANSEILAIKPQMVISTAVFGSRSDAYTHRLQDWAAWNAEGILDLCIPMNYTSTNSTFNSRVDDAFNNQGIRKVYMGQGAYLNTASNSVAQLNYCRTKGLGGTVFYSYRVPNSGTVNQTATFTYVRDNYQPTYEAPPILPWKASPTGGIVKGTVTRQDTGAAVYNATVTLLTPASKTQKTEPHGKYAFFEADTGTYSVQASAPGLGTATGTANVVAGQVVNVNLVLGGTDSTPPVISGVTSSSVTDGAATITWTTDEPSSSVVEYGATTSYGSSASGASSATNHSVLLAGLSPSTTYHFRVKSTDGSNNTATSGDFTFTTLAAGTVQDIVIDNPGATPAGSWTLATSAVDKYGADYVYKGIGTGAAYLTYTPNVLTAGNYEVYEWHSQGTNRGTDTPHVITHAAGSTTVDVNQQLNGGKWNLLGTFPFAAGNGGNVRITDGFSVSGQVAIADAVKLVYAGAAPVPTVPAAPSALTGTGVSKTQINLTWSDNSSDETNFVVEYRKASANSWTAITVGANTTARSVTGLTRNTSYNFRVKATNASGSSAWSNTATVSTTK